MKKAINFLVLTAGALAFVGCNKEVKIPVSFLFTANEVIVDVPPTLTDELNVTKNFYLNLDSLAKANNITLDNIESVTSEKVFFTMKDTTTIFEPVTMGLVEKFSGKINNNAGNFFVDKLVDENVGNTLEVVTDKIDIKEIAKGSKYFDLTFTGKLRKPLDHAVKVGVKTTFTIKGSLITKK